MSRIKKSRKSKSVWVGIILLIVTLGTLVYMSLYNGEVVTKKTASSNVIKKLTTQVLINGGEFEITQEDMNGLIKLYFKEPLSKGNISVKEINTEMKNSEILIEAPMSYKNIDLLFSTTGKLNVMDGEITYVADNFKIGKITLPKALVMSQISKSGKGDIFYVEDNIVKINTEKFPLKINSLEIKEDKMVGALGFKGVQN
ncbi:MAG: hypothetical protein ACREVX_04605 [Clostridium sp.]|uniref:hypothetical protein n=1 Tax=Clostridium sp. TaxID=1506 RepID=UPI003D6C9789